jgi:hydrogenase maturation protease
VLRRASTFTGDFCPDPAPCAVTIAGAGNPHLSCDRIGPHILSRIIGRYGEDVELVETGIHGLALLDLIRKQDLLIVIDACIGSGPPGSVVLRDLSISERPSRGASAHQIGPMEAFLVARYLYSESIPKRSILITVETRGLGEQEERTACERAIQALDREIEAWRATRGQRKRPWKIMSNCTRSRD